MYHIKNPCVKWAFQGEWTLYKTSTFW